MAILNHAVWNMANIKINDKVILWANRCGRVEIAQILSVCKVNKTTFKCNGLDYLFYKDGGHIRGEESWWTHQWVTRYSEEQVKQAEAEKAERQERNDALAYANTIIFRSLPTSTLKAIKELVESASADSIEII